MQEGTHLRVGTAGWTLPKLHADRFPVEGSHLERYARMMSGVEVNSSFYRPHQKKTWERWGASTPDGFRFSVKLPKAITHASKLVNAGGLLQAFLDQASGLGEKMGPLLIQLPPSLVFDAGTAREFFTTLRELHGGGAVLEPRHASWFTSAADRVLCEFEVARVAADPAKASPTGGRPGGWGGLRYFRLHGSPRTYYSEYSKMFLRELAEELLKQPEGVCTWVVFDNTALGHATLNALELAQLLKL